LGIQQNLLIFVNSWLYEIINLQGFKNLEGLELHPSLSGKNPWNLWEIIYFKS